MSDTNSPTYSAHYYFVDEAGDPTIYDRKGRVVVGQPGCSTFFALGTLEVGDRAALAADLESLRQELALIESVRRAPSFRKTMTAFHAKDDTDTVRTRVFERLANHDVRFFALVVDKRAHQLFVKGQNEGGTRFRYRPNSIYDSMTVRLFQDRLHKADVVDVRFARRGKSDRTAALYAAIEMARDRFEKKWKKVNDATIFVEAASPVQHPGLQAADYFLWALQRMFERGEDRYWEMIRHRVSLVVDADDRARRAYGEYYLKGSLRLATLLERKRVPGI